MTQEQGIKLLGKLQYKHLNLETQQKNYHIISFRRPMNPESQNVVMPSMLYKEAKTLQNASVLHMDAK